MGITGLHTLLKSIQKPCNIKKFKGQTLGVDAYGWLHRGSVAFALDIALERHTTKFIDFALHRVRMLLYYGITPYIVFDGGPLPSKDSTEETRLTRREESRKLGLELYRAGRTAQAQQELQKAIDVTPYMARVLIEELKKLNVQYVVAPYEADAQLVYLEKEGIINGIISEDSDMLVFGAKVLISKLDKYGECIEINRANFSACRDVSLVGWTDESFRQMCILSGCDYLPNIPKLGLKTAYRNLGKFKSVERVVKMAQFNGRSRVPPNYLEEFKRAELTFLHQRVFCPNSRKLVPLNPIPPHIHEDWPFIGDDIPADVAISIACGDLDPITKQLIHIQPSYPERARLVQRRQTLPSTAEKRPKKPINTFFTPKRIPLGELDPNSLTPSPSQQALLTRNSRRSWPVRLASPSQQSFLPTPPSSLRSTVDRDTFLSRAGVRAQPIPGKRQRLCSDAAEDATGILVGQSSRYFQAAHTTGSPQDDPKNARHKKAKKADFGIFSDDSVENAMREIHDGMEAAEPKCDLKGKDCFQNTSSSQGQSDLGLREQFAYLEDSAESSKSSRSAGTRRGLPGIAALTPSATPRDGSRLTPLQRLQQSAISRSKSMNILKVRTSVQHFEQRGYESDQGNSSSNRRKPSQSIGSEDLIVPCTDDSSDTGPLSSEEKSPRFGSLDLAQFKFSPN